MCPEYTFIKILRKHYVLLCCYNNKKQKHEKYREVLICCSGSVDKHECL